MQSTYTHTYERGSEVHIPNTRLLSSIILFLRHDGKDLDRGCFLCLFYDVYCIHLLLLLGEKKLLDMDC